MIEHFANYMIRHHSEITLTLIQKKLHVSPKIARRVYYLIKKKIIDAKRLRTRRANELAAKTKAEVASLSQM